MKTVLLFAYDPRNHWMIREWVPVEELQIRESQLRFEGWEVSHMPPEPPSSGTSLGGPST
jgi:hypothetical protein